ncbi:BPTI/Kunitz domain-containing protein-like isoform X2 [Uloborus diversus]|uniref:BPTI/Kunitz domain-containing protein-like isoform X2 n=1 Tax=Uloborus diversus TaxID=327109 RepID=UPI002409ABB7|nr:BPTI/Kunitz domain-containing protein-like isoform X2 [Uloborus diversus]
MLFWTIIVLITSLTGASKKEDICTLDPDEGSCTAYVQMYFFNQYSGQCHEFVYGGCLGNKNQFESREECEEFCKGMALDKTDECTKPADRGPCSGFVVRHYYDEAEDDCYSFVYGGCRGNANNFATRTECMETCSKKNYADQTVQLSKNM